jgi:hypothetical protein
VRYRYGDASLLLAKTILTTARPGFLLFGYDQGVFGGILTNTAFLRTFNNPDPTIQGQIVSTYDIGCKFFPPLVRLAQSNEHFQAFWVLCCPSLSVIGSEEDGAS